MTYLLALDQGTSSSRSIVFDAWAAWWPWRSASSGRSSRSRAGSSTTRTTSGPPNWPPPARCWPVPGWPLERSTHSASPTSAKPPCCGTAATGQPVHNAIVWQDRRTEPTCARMRAEGLAPLVQAKTGLVIDPYFSGTKLKWLLDNVPGAREQARRGELAFGTIDTWLMWQLTGGRVHATDVTNASRTLLFNIHTHQWDAELLALLDIPPEVLPQVHPSSHAYGQADAAHLGAAITIGGVAGDQQSALFGQACFDAGMAKNTYGTGCFMLMHTGGQCQTSGNGLIATRAAQVGTSSVRVPDDGAHRPGGLGGAVGPQYALEGSVFIGGAVVQWLRDGLHAIQGSGEVQALAESVPDAGGVMFVPAFTGLGAPYWDADARGAIVGLTRGSTVAHIARAALESIAYQSAALLQAMSRDAVAAGGAAVSELRVDGGACVNDLLMQFQADLLGIPVVRPKVIETTALGAAYLAGLSTGVYASTAELHQHWQTDRVFHPTFSRERAQDLMARWERAVRQTTAH
jgi:glycerol kinase